MKKLMFIFMPAVFIIAFSVRLYKLQSPVADWHSWRQSDTAAVARNFLKFGFDPLRPRYDDLSNIQSGKDNPMGYRMVEFPLYQLFGAGLAKIFPQFTIEIWLRLVTILSSSATSILLILLISQLISPAAGILTGFIFAILPYSVYYGRSILPEPFMVFWSILSLYFLVQLEQKNGKAVWVWLIMASLAAAAALLVKPYAAFLLVPSGYLIYRKFSFSCNLFICLFVYSFICLFPLFWWRSWINAFPEGIPVSSWLFNDGNIRFKGAWFYWLFAKRLGELILGFWGLMPFALGILTKPEKEEGWFSYWLILGGLSYLVIFAAGNVRHDYYQITLIPVVCVFLAKGFSFILFNKNFPFVIRHLSFVICFLFMLSFSWYTIRTFYWINRPEIVEAGRLADKILPPEAKVIASYNGDTTFLYQINRQGWPLGFDIDKKLAMGATHYVTVSPTDNDWETRELAEKYTVLVRNDKFAIIDLTHKK